MSLAGDVTVAADDTDEDREADGVRLSCSRRSNGEERRSYDELLLGLFLFLEGFMSEGSGRVLDRLVTCRKLVLRCRLLLPHFEVVLDLL